VALIDLFNPLLDAIKRALGPFGKLFDLIGKFWTNLTSLGSRVQRLYLSILAEIQAWRTFKEDISFRTRVINVKSAIEKTGEFIDQFKAAWSAVKDLVENLKGKFQTAGDPVGDAKAAVDDIEASGFKGILEKFPRLAKGLEKVLGFVALLADALESISSGIDDLQAILDTITALREEIETGSTVFLQQKNARRYVKLKDGGSIKIRVGNLHA
jgi:phage-related minor tail protein